MRWPASWALCPCPHRKTIQVPKHWPKPLFEAHVSGTAAAPTQGQACQVWREAAPARLALGNLSVSFRLAQTARPALARIFGVGGGGGFPSTDAAPLRLLLYWETVPVPSWGTFEGGWLAIDPRLVDPLEVHEWAMAQGSKQ